MRFMHGMHAIALAASVEAIPVPDGLVARNTCGDQLVARVSTEKTTISRADGTNTLAPEGRWEKPFAPEERTT